MKVLIIAEHDNTVLKSANAHVLNAGQSLGTTDILIIGYRCESVLTDLKKFSGIQKIIVADAEIYEHQLPENTASLIADIAKNYDYLIGPASTFGKNILPRVAALLDVGMISDVINIISHDTFIRPIYAGNALATVQSLDPIKILTIRPTAFSAVTENLHANVTIQTLSTIIPNNHSQFITQELTESKRPELTAARIIVSGGRGFKTAENFKLLEKLADQLNGAVGATRAAVDAGLAPNDYQVGQTGKIVAPELYIAIGISGAIQHLAGMKDSKIIVAINNDPDAPIFQIADYGLVADLFDALKELDAELAHH